MGTTGERAALGASAASSTRLTDRPVLLGFGISTPDQAPAAGHADGVVVAPALMRRLLDGAGPRPGGPLATSAGTDQGATMPRRHRVPRHRRRSPAKIRSGHYAPGEALPAQRELRLLYGVTMMTLRQALQASATRG